MTARFPLAIAVTVGFTIVLALVAPARQVSGDTVPGRYGAAVLRCGGGFDLSRADFIDERARAGQLPYWAQHDRDGGVISTFGPGPAIVGALAMPGDGAEIDDVSLRRRERIAAAVMLALAAGLLVLAAAARRGLRASVAIGGLAVVSYAGAATLGQALWQQTAALPFVVGAIAGLAWQHRAPRAALVTPALAMIALLLRPALAPLAIGIGIAWCLERKTPRMWAVAAAIAVVAALPLIAWNVAYLGSPLPLAQATANAALTDEVFVLSRAQLGYGLGGLIGSPARGLVWFAPIALVGIVLALRRNPRPERVLAIALCAQILMMALFYRWWGGIGYGPRLLAEVTWAGIWLALGSGVALDVGRRLRVLGAVAIAMTIVVGQLGLWGWRAEQWETRRNPDIDQNALWDFTDSPVVATLRSVDDELLALDVLDAPARVRCVAGRLRSVR